MTVIAGSLRSPVVSVDRLAGPAVTSRVPAQQPVVPLRFVGMVTSRHEVAERIQNQLVIKRQLRAAWLREQQTLQVRQSLATPVGMAGNVPRNGALNGVSATSSSAQQMISDYGHFLSGHPIHLSLCMAQRSPFQSRRQVAERILSRFYGLSGKSLDDEIDGFLLSAVGGHSEGGGHAGSAMGGGAGGNSGDRSGEQRNPGEGTEESLLPVNTSLNALEGGPEVPAVAGSASPTEGGSQKLSADLKNFLLAEMALTSPALSAERKLQASRIKNQLLTADGAAIEAAQTLAMVAVERAEDQTPVSSERASIVSVLSGGGLHDICNHLLSLHPAESVMKAIAALINSVEILGNNRTFRHEGLALSECLTRIRNLSVIMLIMEKTERLRSRLLFGLNTGRLPSDETIWRSICKLTSSRSVEPLMSMLQEGDMSPLVKRTFIQELMGILRELPISVWTDKDSRSNTLAAMGELTSIMVPARVSGK